MTFALLSVAGGLGAVLRFVVDSLVNRRIQAPMPLGTLTVNVLGSFILGLVTGLVAAHILPAEAARIAGTGFCGGFTTFSTASVDAARLGFAGRPGVATAYMTANLAGSVTAAVLGLALATAL